MTEPAQDRPGADDPRRQGPVEIDASDPRLGAPAPPIEDAPPLPDETSPAMARAVAMAAGQGGGLIGARGWIGPLFWSALSGLVGLGITLWITDFVTGLFARTPALGWVGAALAGALALALLALAVRELAGLSRLQRADAAQRQAVKALAEDDRAAAIGALARLSALWAGRKDMEWGLERLEARKPELLDAAALLAEAEHLCLAPLDDAARRAATEGARQVAAATAFIPVPFADVGAALVLNLRMIRRIAEIYGGRAGMIGSWRLMKAVAAHLAATGAVAMGDDLLGPVLGGGALAKLSRRFGEGLVNGALTARVGAAAMEVCRPLPFEALPRPKARALVAAALGKWGEEDVKAIGPR
ncbi:MAG: putative membrane protein [Paracoccaceae bacterium]|jgi:putative membrane protein